MGTETLGGEFGITRPTVEGGDSVHVGGTGANAAAICEAGVEHASRGAPPAAVGESEAAIALSGVPWLYATGLPK